MADEQTEAGGKKKITILYPMDLLLRIEDFRRAQRPFMPPQTEAIFFLIERGLEAWKRDQLRAQQRDKGKQP